MSPELLDEIIDLLERVVENTPPCRRTEDAAELLPRLKALRESNKQHEDYKWHVERFGKVMVARLARRKNRRKGGWGSASVPYLFRRLLEEVAELYATQHEDPPFENFVAMECADVANFAMMIAERSQSTKWLTLHDGLMT